MASIPGGAGHVAPSSLGGRYLHGAYTGMFTGMPFEGFGVTAYDNVTRRFMSAWIDNFSTGIMFLTGKYNPATKATTLVGDVDGPMMPGTKVKVREVIRLVDANKHVMEMYEVRGGKDVKTIEIVYTRRQ